MSARLTAAPSDSDGNSLALKSSAAAAGGALATAAAAALPSSMAEQLTSQPRSRLSDLLPATAASSMPSCPAAATNAMALEHMEDAPAAAEQAEQQAAAAAKKDDEEEEEGKEEQKGWLASQTQHGLRRRCSDEEDEEEMAAAVALPAQRAQTAEDEERKTQMKDDAPDAGEHPSMNDTSIGAAAALPAASPPSTEREQSQPQQPTAERATEREEDIGSLHAPVLLSKPLLARRRPGVTVASLFSLNPRNKGGAASCSEGSVAGSKPIRIHPDVRALMDDVRMTLEEYVQRGWHFKVYDAKQKVTAARKEAAHQAILDAAPQRDRPDRRPAAAAASRKLMQQAQMEEQLQAASKLMHGLHDKAALMQHQLQSDICECRKQLMTAVSKRDKASAAREAARLYQLTHPPPPPPPKVKDESEAKAVGDLKNENDLPLSELMRLHPPQVKVKLEQNDADLAVAATPSKKRKHGGKKQRQQLQQNGSGSSEDGDAGHVASAARQRKRRKCATSSQVRHAAELAQSESDDNEDAGDMAASASRRSSRRAAVEASQKLHEQSVTGKRNRGRHLSEERKHAYADSDASEDEDSSTARAAARPSRRSFKQRDDSAAAASDASSSSDNTASDANDGDDAAEESDSGSALSELSAAESDDELESEPDVFEFDDDAGEEWKPAAASASVAARRRTFGRPTLSLLKIHPLQAVQRFILDELDVEAKAGPARLIVKHLLEILDARNLARVLNLQGKRTGSTLLQLFIARCVSGAGVRKLLPKLLKAARRRLDVVRKNSRGETIVHTLTDVKRVYSTQVQNYKRPDDPSPPTFWTMYFNHARKLTNGLLISAIRKGGNFNQPDAQGRVPLLSLAKLVSWPCNVLNTPTFAELALGTSAKRVPPDWSLTDARGNTALHLLFSCVKMPWRHPRLGSSVQEFARTLCRDTAAAKAALSHIDLLAENAKGKSIIRLIAQHCVHPRSRRTDEDRHNYRYHGTYWTLGGDPIVPPERFPNCLHTHEKLYAAWMQMRAPLVKRELETHLIPDLANIIGAYLLGPRPRGVKLSSQEKRAVFGISAAEMLKAQQWYIARAREVHEWPMELQEMYHHHYLDPLDDEIDLGPMDEHPFHSSGDEAACSKREVDEEDKLDVAVPPPEADLQAAGVELEVPVAVAAAPTVDAPVAMDLDD